MRPERVRQVLFSFTGLFAFVIATALPSVAFAAPAAAAADPHPFTVHDLLAMQRISDPQVSPDGKQVLFTLRTTDLDANAGRNDLWLVGSDGSGLRQLTTHKSSDFNGRWAADGRSVYFLSTRSGSSQVFRLAFDGGEAVQVTDLPVDVSNLELSPDGKLLAFSLEVFPACGADLSCTKKRLDENDARKASGKIYDSLFIRHWDTWGDGRRNHLFVMPATGPAMATTAVDVMPGFDADAPSKPFGGAEEFTFTPDGKGVVYSARNVGRSEAWSTNFDLFYSPIDGSAVPRQLTTNPAWDTQPNFSPDGKQLVYMKMARPGFEADRFVLVVREGLDGADRVLTQAWDRSADTLEWSEDSASLLVTTHDVGQRALYRVDASTGEAKVLVGQGTVKDVRAAGGRIFYSAESLTSPTDLYSLGADGAGAPRRLTQLNQKALENVTFGAPEQFSFPGWNNETVHAWVLKPANFDPKKKYPLAFLIHGGPQGSFGNDFHYRWNPQVYAGAGFVAVMVDFHGSTGYGQAFTDSIRGDWGGKPLEDLQKGLAAALARYPFIDKTKMCALGASYGGYMVNWIAGQMPDTFRCLVSHDGNLDEHMAYYDTEELWFPEWEHGGVPWEKKEGYTRHNPIDFVAKWKTPMLVVHGGKDYRVVDTQGLATFTALQRRGIESRLLYFPDEGHWVQKPQNSVLWHDTVLAWLKAHTQK